MQFRRAVRVGYENFAHGVLSCGLDVNTADLALRLNQGNDLFLVAMAFLVALRALGLVAVICFVSLYGFAFAAERRGRFVHHSLADAMAKEPRAFVGHA